MAYATIGVSADGKYIAFESDWNGQTGAETFKNYKRIDVFILDATTSGVGVGPAPPKTPTATVQ